MSADHCPGALTKLQVAPVWQAWSIIIDAYQRHRYRCSHMDSGNGHSGRAKSTAHQVWSVDMCLDWNAALLLERLPRSRSMWMSTSTSTSTSRSRRLMLPSLCSFRCGAINIQRRWLIIIYVLSLRCDSPFSIPHYPLSTIPHPLLTELSPPAPFCPTALQCVFLAGGRYHRLQKGAFIHGPGGELARNDKRAFYLHCSICTCSSSMVSPLLGGQDLGCGINSPTSWPYIKRALGVIRVNKTSVAKFGHSMNWISIIDKHSGWQFHSIAANWERKPNV